MREMVVGYITRCYCPNGKNTTERDAMGDTK